MSENTVLGACRRNFITMHPTELSDALMVWTQASYNSTFRRHAASKRQEERIDGTHGSIH